MTDEEIIARAERAGWEWCENYKWVGMVSTGWKVSETGFHNCDPGDKAKSLRAIKSHDGFPMYLGFEHDLDCVECGKPIWLMWLCDKALIARKECLGCHHWMEIIRKHKDDGVRVVRHDINGKLSHYIVGEAKTPHQWNGFGGDWWAIKFFDGRTVKTCDLWAQGEIPSRFQDRLPENAVFEERS